MDHKFSEIDHVTPLFKFFLVVHLQTHSGEGLKDSNFVWRAMIEKDCHLKEILEAVGALLEAT